MVLRDDLTLKILPVERDCSGYLHNPRVVGHMRDVRVGMGRYTGSAPAEREQAVTPARALARCGVVKRTCTPM